MKRFVRSAARDDIERQFRYYLVERGAEEIAWRFLDAVEEAVKALVRNPGIGSPVLFRNEKLKGMRSWPVPGFENIRVYYLDRGSSLRIVRVLHGRRDLKRILNREDI